jgi:hypothetical protein
MSMKNSSETIGNRTRDLLDCSAVPRQAGYLSLETQHQWYWRYVYSHFIKLINNIKFLIFSLHLFLGATASSGPGPSHYRGFTITLRHITLGRTPLDKWSARRRDLYLAAHNTQKRQTSLPPAGFEPAIPASEWPHTHALDRAVTGIGIYII